jgi:ribosomal protein S18 acetylase RimI-like enzyme
MIRTTPPWLSQLQIRILVQADLPALEWGGEFTHFRRLYQDVYQNTCRGRAVMWGADLPERGIIGQVFVQLDSGRKELADGASRAYVYGFRVQAGFRNTGVGSRLLQAVELDLAQREFRWVTLNVGRQNLAARRFYERHGYRVIAAEPGHWSYLDDQGLRREVHEPAWRMEKRLN